MNRYLIIVNVFLLYAAIASACVQRPMIGAKEILPIGGLDVLGSSLLTKETCSETSFAIPKNYVQKWELEKTNTCDDSWLSNIFKQFILMEL